MKIALILTGGTIGSVEAHNVKDVNASKTTPLLAANFNKKNKKEDFEILTPLNILSENIVIQDWNILLDCIKTIDLEKCKGIIITHGTDTLAYTCAFIAVAMQGIEIPVVFVSSQFPLQDERSNGSENFQNAVEIINDEMCGVYAVYRNNDGISYIHEGEKLIQCTNYSNNFYSETMYITGQRLDFKGQNKILEEIGELENNVLLIEPYVGIDYNAFNIKGKKAVLHSTYHSSTACTSEGNILEFIDKCKKEGVLFFLSPFQKDEAHYISTKKILDKEVIPIPNLTKEHAYAKILIGISMYKDKEKISNFVLK